jgi:lysyl-tRNA synthetase class 2
MDNKQRTMNNHSPEKNGVKRDDNQLILDRVQKLTNLREDTGNAYPNHHRPSGRATEIILQFGNLEKTEIEKQEISLSLAGRVILKRNQGKTTFIVLKDSTGKLQLYLNREILGEDRYNFVKQIDLGDQIYCNGTLFKTMRGELTLSCIEVEILAKSIRPLPEKFHGLQDPDLRYRNRHIDLIANDGVKDIFLKRSKLLQNIREFMNKQNFIEVETPMLHPIPGGATARPFVTKHNALDQDMYLRVAPELYLKRLIVGGFERVFELNRSFRNEGISVRHNPEFTMLEFYAAYQDYHWLMTYTENLLRNLCLEILGKDTLIWDEKEINFACPFEKISYEDALRKHVKDFDGTESLKREKLVEVIEKHGLSSKVNCDSTSTDVLTVFLFEAIVESKLVQPTFITDHPVEISPLARESNKNPGKAERFELYIGGKEIANGFSELNDPQEQSKRLLIQAQKKKDGDKEAMYFDEDYIKVLETGMPPTAGCGIGIDRLLMAFTNSHSIREVIFFPALKGK